VIILSEIFIFDQIFPVDYKCGSRYFSVKKFKSLFLSSIVFAAPDKKTLFLVIGKSEIESGRKSVSIGLLDLHK